MTDRPPLSEDKRHYFPNRPAAQDGCNWGQRKYGDQGAYSAVVQFEPGRGFVAVLLAENNIPDAWDDGFEVQTKHFVKEKTPADWAEKKKPATSTVSTGAASSTPSAPKGGTTARVWAIADAVVEEKGAGDIKALRATIIATCEAEGINKSTAGTQYSKWKRAKGL